jgi:hypothetical protein
VLRNIATEKLRNSLGHVSGVTDVAKPASPE